MALSSPGVEILPVDTADPQMFAGLLALNNAHEKELSWLEPAQLKHMSAQAFAFTRIGQAEAFLLAFDRDADYASPNFLWFRARYDRFVYVDRIAVAAAARGRGYARLLYEDLFERAAKTCYSRIVCEVNSHPPNPASDAFHARLGFMQVGCAEIYGGERRVRYFERALSD